MEEHVGILWHRMLGNLLNKKLNKGQTEQHSLADRQIKLVDVQHKMAIVFRTMACNGSLQLESSFGRQVDNHRSFLQKLAGSNPIIYSAWIENDTLYLPEQISLFATAELNQSLYLWLTAMAASDFKHPCNILKNQPIYENYWFVRNQQLTLMTLEDFPGLTTCYQQLLEETLKSRPDTSQLSQQEQQQEQTIVAALKSPGSQELLAYSPKAPAPVALWLIQSINQLANEAEQNDDEGNENSDPDIELESTENTTENKRKQAERVKNPDGRNGLIAVRMENIFSWAEFLKVDRTTDDDEDPEAGKKAEDMDHLSLARDKQRAASKINFNLDLPAAAYDDTILNDGILYPEWNYKKSQLIADQCSIIPMLSLDADDCELPPQLYKPARKVKRVFEALAPARRWFRGEFEGSELDLDAFIQFNSDRFNKRANSEQGLYRQFRPGNRDLATLLLADLSLSTDSAINNDAKIIDVIRDSLFLFSEALTQTGDRYALYGFSSRKKDHVRFNQIKTFDEPLNAKIRGRIQAIKPGYYTRLGAAIRHATTLLEKEMAEKKILLILTDGKPNDLDHYEGRYGIEDTRHAVMEAKSKGLYPFCFTVDREGSDYLPHLFGPNGYTIIRKPEELPSKLPMLYAELTQR
ncbi:MAG: VWA domain-containing protein [Pseudomonadota bacterium]